jgi:hypothetical protein
MRSRPMRSLPLATFVLLFNACGSTPDPAVVSIETTPQYQDAALLSRAWELPVAVGYRKGFSPQENGSLCGMATTVNLMSSLGLTPPSQKSLVIGAISPYLGVELFGVTLDELADIVRGQTGRTVTVARDLSLAEFRAHLTATNDPARRYTVNFTRKPLFGRGGGHHSPIGGYLADLDLVFVLDVNAAYQPFLVSPERLYAAVDTVDSASGRKRGLLIVE